MPTLASIEIEKSYLHFSAAHFTIFSATNRERLHGHNWRVAVEITGEIGDDGLCFDYAIYKQILRQLCAKYDEYTLIAEQSPYLKITEDSEFYYIEHDGRTQPLLKTDTILMPVQNITIEALANYFLLQMTEDKVHLDQLKIHGFEMRVSSGPNQWGICRWSR
ncbi:MAG: 6-carboxytetrahydropterin synthase [Arenicella sp.]|nr:6-carboxytetrahydropterin synthase [Arenicella sp.]